MKPPRRRHPRFVDNANINPSSNQTEPMRSILTTILNIIWLVFAGLPMAIGYCIAGVVCCILIVTIPWGIASFRIAGYVIWPFGRMLITRPDAGLGSALGNVIWFIFAGWWLILAHICSAIALMVTIIGIPLGIAEVQDYSRGFCPAGQGCSPN